MGGGFIYPQCTARQLHPRARRDVGCATGYLVKVTVKVKDHPVCRWWSPELCTHSTVHSLLVMGSSSKIQFAVYRVWCPHPIVMRVYGVTWSEISTIHLYSTHNYTDNKQIRWWRRQNCVIYFHYDVNSVNAVCDWWVTRHDAFPRHLTCVTLDTKSIILRQTTYIVAASSFCDNFNALTTRLLVVDL